MFSTSKTNRTHGNLTTKLKAVFCVFGVRRKRDEDRIASKKNTTMSTLAGATRAEYDGE